MYFRLMGKLNARRNGQLAENEKGFTLIELLVVVIIIGILAAIAIPVYLGVQKNAKDSAIKTDVANFKTAVISAETELGAVPDAASWTGALTGKPAVGATDSTGTWADAGVTLSTYEDTATTNFVYKVVDATKGTFTITAKSKTGNCFGADDTNGVSKIDCPAP